MGRRAARKNWRAWVCQIHPVIRRQFAKGHLEQLGHATGKLELKADRKDREFKFDGLGLRDHSWGPRYWQAPKFYRWLTMNFDEDPAGWHDYREPRRQRTPRRIRRAQRTADVISARSTSDRIRRRAAASRSIKLNCETSDGGAPIVITGKVQSMIPLRNRRAGIVTRIAEGMTEWNWEDKIGYGLAEYSIILRTTP